MSNDQHVVLAQWDSDAGVWFVKATDVPGLNVEAATFDEFVEIVSDVAPDLLEANVSKAFASIVVKAEALARVKRGAAA